LRIDTTAAFERAVERVRGMLAYPEARSRSPNATASSPA